MKKITGIILLLLAVIILAACQANYIRDVQGGTTQEISHEGRLYPGQHPRTEYHPAGGADAGA